MADAYESSSVVATPGNSSSHGVTEQIFRNKQATDINLSP